MCTYLVIYAELHLHNASDYKDDTNRRFHTSSHILSQQQRVFFTKATQRHGLMINKPSLVDH